MLHFSLDKKPSGRFVDDEEEEQEEAEGNGDGELEPNPIPDVVCQTSQQHAAAREEKLDHDTCYYSIFSFVTLLEAK